MDFFFWFKNLPAFVVLPLALASVNKVKIEKGDCDFPQRLEFATLTNTFLLIETLLLKC